MSGNKNSALPLLVACLLTDEECVLRNMPRIRDVEVMVRLLEGLGADVHGLGTNTLRVRCANVRGHEPDRALVGRLRGSVLLLGALLARAGAARLAPPGGDFPTRRTIATHLQGLVALGARPMGDDGHALEAPDGLKGAHIYLDEASVTGTETLLLAAVAAKGTTRIRHAAAEPHVVGLCRFLKSMGASITGEGSSTLLVEGGARLRGATHTLEGDYIEAGSWGVIGAITRGSVEVTGARGEDMEVIASLFRRMGVRCTLEDDRFGVEESPLVAPGRIITGLWPAFPSDMVSLATVLATQAVGRTLVHDWMYELRLFALEQLSGMGADLFLCDPHRIIVRGPSALTGRHLDSRDLRSGMALIAAALTAKGRSQVAPIETVERGYEDVVDRLRSLGAQVELVGERTPAGA